MWYFGMCFAERGEYVVREDENVDAVYFLLEGEVRVYSHRNIDLDYYWLFATGCLIEFCLQAQVLRSAVEENCSELLLRRFDFFGRGERMILSILPILQFQCVNYCGLWQVWLGDWISFHVILHRYFWGYLLSRCCCCVRGIFWKPSRLWPLFSLTSWYVNSNSIMATVFLAFSFSSPA